MTTTSPLVPHTAPVILCSAHYSDAPATCEDYYVIAPGTADERGEALARCGDETCRQANLEYIASVGDYTETVDLPQPAVIAPHRIPKQTCADCGVSYLFDPSKRHDCPIPGNPTDYRIGQTVAVPTADGDTVPGSIVDLAQRFGVVRAEVHVPAFRHAHIWMELKPAAAA